MSRRRVSATALKASEVVAARGMFRIYSHIGICQALFFRFFSTPSFAVSLVARTHLPEHRSRLIFDLDSSVPTVFGHQEGAEVGYNPRITVSADQILRRVHRLKPLEG